MLLVPAATAVTCLYRMGYYVKVALLQTPDIKLSSSPTRRQLINDRYGKTLELCMRLFGFSGFCNYKPVKYSYSNTTLCCHVEQRRGFYSLRLSLIRSNTPNRGWGFVPANDEISYLCLPLRAEDTSSMSAQSRLVGSGSCY